MKTSIIFTYRRDDSHYDGPKGLLICSTPIKKYFNYLPCLIKITISGKNPREKGFHQIIYHNNPGCVRTEYFNSRFGRFTLYDVTDSYLKRVLSRETSYTGEKEYFWVKIENLIPKVDRDF